MQKVYLIRHIGENTFVYFKKSIPKKLYPVLSHDYSFRWYTNPPLNHSKYTIIDNKGIYYLKIQDINDNIYRFIIRESKLDIYKLGIPKITGKKRLIKFTDLRYNASEKEIISI